MYLNSKFLASQKLFSIEYSKINYIRDKYKDIAFNVIKVRAKLSNPSYYTLVIEAIADLNNIFGKYNKEGRTDTKLYNLKFAIGIKDTKEIFNTFFARFTIMVAPLNLLEFQKISNIRRLVSNRLRNKVINGTILQSFRRFISRLRQLDVDIKVNDKINPRSTRGGGGNKSGNSTTGTRGERGTLSTTRGNQTSISGSRPSTNKFGYTAYVIERLRKENRCFKCLKLGYQSFYTNVPYKDIPAPNKEQRIILLTIAGINISLLESPAVELQAENQYSLVKSSLGSKQNKCVRGSRSQNKNENKVSLRSLYLYTISLAHYKKVDNRISPEKSIYKIYNELLIQQIQVLL